MNALMTAFEPAYGNPALRGARDVEYDAFSKVTRMLSKASQSCEGMETVKAVSGNNELWTLLVDDLSHPQNELDETTKAGLLSLAIFSLRHGKNVLAGAGGTNVLIEINMSVMKGLRGERAK